MKIVHVASADLWGGAEAQVCALATALATHHRADVSVILMNRGSRLANELRANGIATAELDETTTSMGGLFGQIRRQLRAVRPDIVHTHRLKEDILGGAAAALAGIPSIRTVHGAPEPETLQGVRRTVLNKADRWIARRLQSRVVAVSTDLMDKLKVLLPGARLTMIPNGISFAAVRTAASASTPELPRSAPGSIRIGFFGRLVGIKRVDLLLQVANELAGVTDRSFDFYIFGEGPLRATLGEQARQIRQPERVHFMGYQGNAAAAMRQMDAVILVSDHEGLPMTLLEAAVLGIPIVARAVGGIPEFMQISRCGVALESTDPRAIAAQLAGATFTAATSQASTTQADAPLAYYSIDATSARYLALYEQVIAARRA
jgi:L-malate glycosyltransferase